MLLWRNLLVPRSHPLHGAINAAPTLSPSPAMGRWHHLPDTSPSTRQTICATHMSEERMPFTAPVTILHDARSTMTLRHGPLL